MKFETALLAWLRLENLSEQAWLIYNVVRCWLTLISYMTLQ